MSTSTSIAVLDSRVEELDKYDAQTVCAILNQKLLHRSVSVNRTVIEYFLYSGKHEISPNLNEKIDEPRFFGGDKMNRHLKFLFSHYVVVILHPATGDSKGAIENSDSIRILRSRDLWVE